MNKVAKYDEEELNSLQSREAGARYGQADQGASGSSRCHV